MKKINKAKKGYRKEKYARDELVKDGWKIVFKSVRYRFGCIDYAQLFDVVAYRKKERKFISCKHFSGSYYVQHQLMIRLFKEEHGLSGESYELWLWHKPHWEGRGKNKIWKRADFKKVII